MSIEVLAPCGTREAVVAAVRAGADAVYFGAENFNARRNADNIGDSIASDTVAYCHIRGVKCFLALNISLKNEELNEAIKIAVHFAKAGIDGIIVADLGLVSLLREALPDVPLHASTQMAVASAECLPLLKEMGFSRVVPAREAGKEQLKEICSKAREIGMEVEVFVHGAHCMCFSGQCYMSSLFGARSGNRGLCAQPCRLPTKFENNDYALSLKDMCLFEHISELKEMGVNSLKIEGRMKGEEYVAAATLAARQAVDNGKVDDELFTLLERIFSRNGFTDGYYVNHIKNMFGIRSEDDKKVSKETVPKLHEIYRREVGRVPLNAKLIIEDNTESSLELSDNDGNTVAVKGDAPQKAINRPTDYESAKKQIEKLSDYGFYLEKLEADIGEGLIVPVSVLNSMRRAAAEKLSEKRGAVNNVLVKDMKPVFNKHYRADSKKIIASFYSAEQIPDNLSNVSAVVLPLGKEVKIDKPLIVRLPRAIVGIESQILCKLESAKKLGAVGALCGTIPAVCLAKKAGLEVIGDYSLNILNNQSLAEIQRIGVKKNILSFENSADAVNTMGENCGIISYGFLPLMINRNCMKREQTSCKNCDGHYYLDDRKGKKMYCKCNNQFVTVHNPIPLFVRDRLREFHCDYELLFFTQETKERCAEIILGKKPLEITRGLYYKELL